MNKIFVILMALVGFASTFTACAATATNNLKPAEQPKNAEVKVENSAPQTKSNDVAKTDSKEAATAKTPTASDKSACLNAKIEGKKLITDQTFAFDYEPFPKSCFVTFANKADMVDDKDVPRGSTFYIFKDGKQVYDFEDAFDGQPACWVEGVGFEDLNSDGKTEVIIAGSCLAAKDSYPVNAVYLNINDDFRTFSSSNETLDNFKTVKQISDFVKKNNNKFFSDK
jgi:hypothetical protein